MEQYLELFKVFAEIAVVPTFVFVFRTHGRVSRIEGKMAIMLENCKRCK